MEWCNCKQGGQACGWHQKLGKAKAGFYLESQRDCGLNDPDLDLGLLTSRTVMEVLRF